MSTLVQVLDTRDTLVPVEVSTTNQVGSGYFAALGSGVLFLADQDHGRVVSLDIRSATSPTVAGTYGGPALAHSVAWGARYGLVADYWNGMSVGGPS